MDHLKRAGFFILTKSDLCTTGEKEQIYGTLRQYNQTAPVAEAVHQPAWCVSFADWYQGIVMFGDPSQVPRILTICILALIAVVLLIVTGFMGFGKQEAS